MSLNFWSPGSNWEIVDNRHHVLFKVNSLVGSRRPPVGSMAAVVVIRGEIPGWRLGRLPPPGKLGRLPPPGKGGPLPARGMPGAFGRNLGGLGESAPSTGGPGLAGPASVSGMRGFLVSAGARLSREPKRECWMTGNLQSTSARYILIKPVNTLPQLGTALMFHRWLLCSWKGPHLTL